MLPLAFGNDVQEIGTLPGIRTVVPYKGDHHMRRSGWVFGIKHRSETIQYIPVFQDGVRDKMRKSAVSPGRVETHTVFSLTGEFWRKVSAVLTGLEVGVR